MKLFGLKRAMLVRDASLIPIAIFGAKNVRMVFAVCLLKGRVLQTAALEIRQSVTKNAAKKFSKKKETKI